MRANKDPSGIRRGYYPRDERFRQAQAIMTGEPPKEPVRTAPAGRIYKTADVLSNPHGEGVDAKTDGKTKSSCPYQPGSQENQEWREGFDSIDCVDRERL